MPIHICLMDRDGEVAWRGKCASDPQVIATVLAKQVARLDAARLVRCVLETGPLSVFFYHGLFGSMAPLRFAPDLHLDSCVFAKAFGIRARAYRCRNGVHLQHRLARWFLARNLRPKPTCSQGCGSLSLSLTKFLVCDAPAAHSAEHAPSTWRKFTMG